MKFSFIFFICLMVNFNSCKEKTIPEKDIAPMNSESIAFRSGYSTVNGLKMYYEVYGKGEPLVLIHGGGSTIETSFGKIIPHLATDFQVIAIELQNHGRSGFRDVPETFEQDADDVAALLKNIEIDSAYIFGFSNGGHTAIDIYLRHPDIVRKLILASSPYSRDCFISGFFDGFNSATLQNMPSPLKEAFLKVNPDTAKLQMMFEKDRDRMQNFKGWTIDQMKSIKVPTLLISGDADVLTPECAVKMHSLISNSELAIVPGGHGKYLGEITTLKNAAGDSVFIAPMIKEFLTK